MRSSIKALLGTAALVLIASAGMGAAPAAAATCPTFGFDTDCGLIITINPDGSLTITSTGQGPYDGVEDTLLGVVNHSGINQPNISISIHVSSILTDAFGFDDDGIQTFGSLPPIGTPLGYVIKGYEGPDNYFANIGVGCTPGTVCGDIVFIGGLPSGTGGGCTGAGVNSVGVTPSLVSCDPNVTYFSLEEQIFADDIGGSGSPGPGEVVPEPATLALFGAGLMGLGALRRRKAKKT